MRGVATYDTNYQGSFDGSGMVLDVGHAIDRVLLGMRLSLTTGTLLAVLSLAFRAIGDVIEHVIEHILGVLLGMPLIGCYRVFAIELDIGYAIGHAIEHAIGHAIGYAIEPVIEPAIEHAIEFCLKALTRRSPILGLQRRGEVEEVVRVHRLVRPYNHNHKNNNHNNEGAHQIARCIRRCLENIISARTAKEGVQGASHRAWKTLYCSIIYCSSAADHY